MYMILPVVILIPILFLLMRNGVNKKILFASVIIGFLSGFASYDNSLYYFAIDAILGFGLWYIVLDVIRRIVFRSKKKTTL